jgi:hypothetical protein
MQMKPDTNQAWPSIRPALVPAEEAEAADAVGGLH